MFRDNLHFRGGSPASTLPTQLTLDERSLVRLQDHLQQLQLIVPVISVTALALRRQSAEQDEDIAGVLMRHAGDPLALEVARLELLLETVAADQHENGVAA